MITKPEYVTTGVSPRNKSGVGFRKGNPGKPMGAVSKTTLLKEKILDAILKRDLEGQLKIFGKKGKILVVPEVDTTDLMKVAATFVPKEQVIKGEGFANVTNIFSGEQVSSEERRELIDALRARRSQVKPT